MCKVGWEVWLPCVRFAGRLSCHVSGWLGGWVAMCQAMHAPGWAAREEVCSIQCSVVHDSLLDCIVVSVLVCYVHCSAV